MEEEKKLLEIFRAIDTKESQERLILYAEGLVSGERSALQELSGVSRERRPMAETLEVGL